MGLAPDTCVFQIRLGGIKGVLTRVPNTIFADICRKAKASTWKTAQIAYRPSMKKYNGGPRVLEIQDASRAPRDSGARLNKHFILLLLTIGIDLKVFEDLLEAQLDTLAKILSDRDAAMYALDGELDADGQGFDQELYSMLLARHDMSEPYVQVHLNRYLDLRHNTLREKLAISVTNSSYLFGVVDPTGTLDEGQVYVNLPFRGGPQTGSILIGRNPAYDPSDLRVLEGVNAKALSHLTNCLVFSTKGKHSETDYMGGSDLDGDQYMVITDEKLIPTVDQRSQFPPRSRQVSTTSQVNDTSAKPHVRTTRSSAAYRPKRLPTSSKTPSPCSWNTTNTCIFSGAFPNYGSPRLRRLLGLETQSSVTDAPYLSKRHSTSRKRAAGRPIFSQGSSTSTEKERLRSAVAPC